MPDPHVRVDRRPDGVAVLTFDQPGGRANVLTARMWADFEAAVDALPGDLRGLVLASAKPGIFIAGADLHLLRDAPGPDDPAVRAFIGHGNRVLFKLEAVPFPTVAAIDGAALGGGLEVALACDHVVRGTNPKVRLALPEASLGLIPGWGGTQRLPRTIPIPDAMAALATGTAIELGAVVPSDELIERAVGTVAAGESRGAKAAAVSADRRVPDEFYGPFRASADAAVRAAADVVARGVGLPLADAVAVETEAFLRLAGSDDAKRRIAAFFDARKK